MAVILRGNRVSPAPRRPPTYTIEITVAEVLPAAPGLHLVEDRDLIMIGTTEQRRQFRSIFGVAERVGSLEAGKDASFLLTDGDPLEIRTRIERVWIGGVEVDLADNPQYRLYEKYDNRPRRATN